VHGKEARKTSQSLLSLSLTPIFHVGKPSKKKEILQTLGGVSGFEKVIFHKKN